MKGEMNQESVDQQKHTDFSTFFLCCYGRV